MSTPTTAPMTQKTTLKTTLLPREFVYNGARLSALKDVIKGQLDAESLRRRMMAIRSAHDQEVSPQRAKEILRKLLQKGESDAALQAFESEDTYNLPPGNTNWRLSNAISWIAGQTRDSERKLDLMKLAGEVLPKAA